ncbi:helix-turn-helix transcriptional regulator [Catalinimonas sp. 4WD22]|uniref:helix-turn-helix domain-containing protein n=1 Tax=Catalinimonas locisalis TaxID=3133978 RepID=UPI0031017152
MMSKAQKHRSELIQGLLSKSKPVDKQKARIKMIIAANIDEAIQEKGWTRSKLANELGVGRSLVSKWLSGTHNFTVDTLVDICQVLETSMVDLLQQAQKKEETYQSQ